MEQIAPTLNAGDTGPQVTNLQDALRLLLDRSVIRSLDPPNSPTAEELAKLGQGLAKERAQSVYGKATQRLVLYIQLQEGLGDGLGGEVEAKTAALLNRLLRKLGVLDEPSTNEFTVKGVVTHANGKPAVGVEVRAFDRDLRTREQVGEMKVTGIDGRYEIGYSQAEFLRAEKDSADLFIRAEQQREGGTVFVESPTLFNAPADAEIDLRLEVTHHTDQSERERYLVAIKPLLVNQGERGADLALAQLKPQDIDFISADTGIERQHVEWLQIAASFDSEADSFYYGMFRQGVSTEGDRLRTLPLATLRAALLEAIDQNIIPASLREQVEDFLLRFPNARSDELKQLPGVAELPVDKLRLLLASADGADGVTDQVLTRLVDTKQFSPEEARQIGLGVSLGRIFKGDAGLVSRVRETRFASLRNERLEQTRDVAKLEERDWEAVLEASDPRDDASARASRARGLAIEVARAFPHTAFVARATRIPSDLEDQLKSVRSGGEGREDRERLQEAQAGLTAFANEHPGLGLQKALADTTPAQGVKIVQERIGWLRTVFEQNPDVNFLTLEYLPDDPTFQQLKFGDLPKEARAQVLEDCKAHRRIHAVTGNPVISREIMRAGLHSASVIARMRPGEFAAKTGLPDVEAQAYHVKASEASEVASTNWIRIFEAARDKASAQVRAIPSTSEFFGPIAGFQELINDQPWCECAHCQSVLSPAAYFVDLMYYIEKHILEDSFLNKETHPLHLKVRRPDLWELELSCKNTNNFVPYLDLVNEVLEAYLKTVLPPADTADIFEFLARQEGSFKQPFTHPIDRLELLLGHFDLSRYDVAQTMGADRDLRVRSRLKLSPKEYDLITGARAAVTDLAFIKQLNLITEAVNVTSSDALFPPIEMRKLLEATGLPHEQVTALLKSRFVNSDGSQNAPVEAKLEKRDSGDVQNNVEWVKNLSLNRLDRIHRFTRLWRKLPWTIQELDWVLLRLSVLNLGSGINAGALRNIVDLLELNPDEAMPLDQLVSMIDIFPNVGLREDVSLFDRLFNQQPFLSRDGRWPPANPTRFTHPAWASNPQGFSAPDNNTLSRLLAGLQLSDRDLVELFDNLKDVPDLGYRPAAVDPVTNQRADESISIWRPSLRLLYHHAQLMKLLDLSATDLNKILSLVPRLADRPAVNRFVRDLEDVQAVVEFSQRQKVSGFSLDEILYLVRGLTVPNSTSAPTLAVDIVAAVASEGSLDFADTVFTELGITDIQSRKLIADNLSTNAAARAFEAVADGQRFRLASAFDLVAGALVINDATIQPPLDVARLRTLLARYHGLNVLDAALGRTLDLSGTETRLLRGISRPLSATETREVIASLQGNTNRQVLEASIGAALRYRALFKSSAFDERAFQFVSSNPTVFGLDVNPALRVITFGVIRSVAAYSALAASGDAEVSDAPPAMDIATLHAVLVDVAGASDANLAGVLRTDRARIGSLKPHLTLPAAPFEALDTLARCLALTNLLGVSGETLILMTKEGADAAATYRNLARAAEDVFAAFRSKYPDEQTFQEKMEPYADKLRGSKRNALVDFLTRKWPEPFADSNKLYAYFLIDVLMEGCARTSRVVAAISSLQLYVQRVILALEFSRDAAVIARFDEPASQHEWYWRKQYRLWQANREIFLYPENYVDPMSLDRKTPPYKELESAFRQGEITDLNVRDAYAKYLDAFDEVARLKIAGAYHDLSPNEGGTARDVLHLFGVTTESPPTYFYRSISKASSTQPVPSAWNKLSLKIPVRKVAVVAVDGRLHLFWLETVTRALTSFVGGNSDFSGYRHALRVKASTLRPDGTWSAPQNLGFVDTATNDSRSVNDPTDKAAIALNNQKAVLAEQVRVLTEDVTNRELDRKARQDELTAAQNLLNTPLTLAEMTNAQAVANRELVRATYAGVFGGALLAGPKVADIAATEAALGVMTRFVAQSSTSTLKGAGVIVGAFVVDFILTAQRKHEVFLAAAMLQIAEANLTLAHQTLAPFKLQLDRLKAAAVTVKWDKSGRDHTQPIDDYSPQGWKWERVYPSVRELLGGAKSIRMVVVPSDEDPAIRPLELDAPAGLLREVQVDGSYWPQMRRLSNSGGAIKDIGNSEPSLTGIGYFFATQTLNTFVQGGTHIATVPPDADVQLVNGNFTSLIVELKGDIAWLRLDTDRKFRISRLSTALTPQLIRRFSERDDLSGLLDLSVQESLKETRSRIQSVAGQSRIDMPDRPFDPDRSQHPFLAYLRETFLHIPFLGAYLANSDQKFSQAQRWYHYIFNPTADGDPWRCLELQLAGHPSLRSLLISHEALEAYRADPFNPHAIARTRLSAYQKAIVMRYIDNLLDWGDSLFSQFTMESVNEATMLYVMAQEILGPRPTQLGGCGEAQVTPRNYNTIRAGLNEVSDFLVELEALAPTTVIAVTPSQEGGIMVVGQVGTATSQQASTMAMVRSLADGAASSGMGAEYAFEDDGFQTSSSYWTNTGGTPLSGMYIKNGGGTGGGLNVLGIDAGNPQLPGTTPAPIDFENPLDTFSGGTLGPVTGRGVTPFDQTPPFEIKYTEHDIPIKKFIPGGRKWPKFSADDVIPTTHKNAAFCIPPNKELLAYWDRVEDRLFKIRNCMDIAGVQRRLELFAPEIDLRLLVRMKAAGLTLDDVLNSIAGNVPPYRFTYLIDKAKQFAGTLQSFGGQLLSALERRDGEELSRLRAVHEQNLLAMRKRTTQLEIDAADDTIASLEQQKVVATYRREYYRTLATVGLIPAESTQQARQKEASQFRTMASVAQFLAGILSVIPDLGAPTAMKFGGSQLGAAGRSVAEGFNAIAAFNDMSATEAGIEASNRRRDQDWKFQAESARLDLLQIDRQIEAAKIRKEISIEAQKQHEKTLEQAEEVFNFLRDKFTSFDRAAFLTRNLRELYRIAFKTALSLGRMTEQAFVAERTEDDTRLSGNYWDAENFGLLAGERLLSDLQALELRYFEKNYRQLEVEQSFSLAQFAPDQLAKLRLTGSCDFSVPELFFDLTYPGQYRRRLKAVRVSIPCVTGPYVNVGATLRLGSSSIRLGPQVEPIAVPPRHTVSIAVSKAQYDAGVLDFNFRDERFMPFEGAGAISTWNLSLPNTIRMFDYGTISDVVLHLAYTADFDGVLQSKLESELQTETIRLLGKLQAKDAPLGGEIPPAPLKRVFSLRKDFPDVYSRLVNSPVDTELTFGIDARHLPFFLMGRPLKATRAALHVISPLKTLAPAGADLTVFAIRRKVETNPPRGFRELRAPTGVTNRTGLKEFDFGNVLSKVHTDAGGIMPALLGEYLIAVKQAGPLAPEQDAAARALDPDKFYDILIIVGYGLAEVS